ncbi:hypothetical protein DDF62_14455 [Caulobacter radicis]|uniref:hypothetical protein n=1 Tax=Caulobacter radicis TaxID=2172650 RepID=UPI000D576778|nr:hypothetical protein [Caulobacter radicis]PVM88396.1 hypothetical protein DDF62_14455 [Caulobacter radicis]
MDTSYILGYTLMGAGSGVVNRLLQNLWPTELEKAQVRNINENLLFQRERLAVEGRRALEEQSFRRDAQIRQIEANIDLEDRRQQLNQWPLACPPRSLSHASRLHGGRSLNVIAKYSRSLALEQAVLTKRLVEIDTALSNVDDIVVGQFGSDVLFYRDSFTQHFQTGRGLASSICSQLGQEPTALIEIAAPSAGVVTFGVSCWGWAGDQGELDVGQKLHLSVSDDGLETEAAIETALLMLVTALNDRFQTVSRMSGRPRLQTAQMLAKLPDIGLKGRAGVGRSLEPQSAHHLLVASQMATFEMIAARSPLLAAEMAARGALEAFRAERKDIAEQLLGQALGYYRLGVSDPPETEADTIAAISSQPVRRTPTFLQEALAAIRGVTFTVEDKDTNTAFEPATSLAETARRVARGNA